MNLNVLKVSNKYKKLIFNTFKINFGIFISIIFLEISCSKSNPDSINITNDYYYLFPYGLLDVQTYKGDAVMINGIYTSNPIVFPRVERYKYDENFLICKQIYDSLNTKELLLMCVHNRVNELKLGNSIVKTVEVDGLNNYIENYKNDSIFLKNTPSIIKNEEDLDPVINKYLTKSYLFKKMKKQQVNFYIFNLKTNKEYLVLSKKEFNNLFIKLKINNKLYID